MLIDFSGDKPVRIFESSSAKIDWPESD